MGKGKVTKITTEKTKDERIQEKYEELYDLFASLPPNKLRFADSMIRRMAFQIVTMEVLEDEITKDGAVIVSTNGNGFDVKQENPAQKSYTQIFAKYTTAYRALVDQLPAEAKTASKLEAFMNAK